MIPTYATLLERRRFGLGLLKSTFNAENFICNFGLSPAILAQFTLEMRVAARNHEKFTKTRYFGGSRSFKVINVDISKKLDASACYDKQMSVPICNHFHVRRAYSGKITLLKGVASLSPPRSRGSPLPSGMKFCHEILDTIGYHIISHLVLDWYRVVTDKRTDRITVANTRYSYASSRA